MTVTPKAVIGVILRVSSHVWPPGFRRFEPKNGFKKRRWEKLREQIQPFLGELSEMGKNNTPCICFIVYDRGF